jgi:hypothetical protein
MWRSNVKEWWGKEGRRKDIKNEGENLLKKKLEQERGGREKYETNKNEQWTEETCKLAT